MLMIQTRSIIYVMVWVLVQLTAKIDWNMGHFLDKINTQLQFPFISFLIFCSSGPYASTFTSSLPLWGHGVKQDQDLKGPTANLANDSQISGLNDKQLDCAHPLVLNNRAPISWARSIMSLYDEATLYVAITKGFRFR